MNKHHQNRKKIAVLIIILVIISVWAAIKLYNWYNGPRVEQTTSFLYLTVVTDKNLTMPEVLGYRNETETKYVIIAKGGLYFYDLSPGWNLTREINITNSNSYQVDVEATIAGNITRFITVEIPQRVLEPQTNEILRVTASIPTENVESGSYRGNLTLRLIPKKT